MATLLKEITENAWIVIDESNDKKIGLLSRNNKNGFVFLENNKKNLFVDVSEVIQYFKEDIFDNIEKTKEDPSAATINGYPTACTSAIEYTQVDKDLPNLPLYTKSEKGRTVFAAGYYCVKYQIAWHICFCPKIETLKKYEFIGPVTDKLQARSLVNSKKRSGDNE